MELRQPATRAERLYKLEADKVKASREAQNFARQGLIPRMMVHPELLKSVTTIASDCLGEEFVSLAKVLQEYERSGSQGIELWNLSSLQHKHDLNEENYYEQNSAGN